MKKVKLSDGRELEIGRLTVRVLENSEKFDGNTAKSVHIIASLTNSTTDEIRDLGLEDFLLLSDEIEKQMPKQMRGK